MVSFCDKRAGFSTILNVQGQIQTATDNSNNCHYMSSHITEPEKQLEVRKSVITQVNMESSGGTSWHNQNRRKFAKESCLSHRSNLLWQDYRPALSNNGWWMGCKEILIKGGVGKKHAHTNPHPVPLYQSTVIPLDVLTFSLWKLNQMSCRTETALQSSQS